MHSPMQIILLLFPISQWARLMIQICEQYAMEYSIVFNPVKSKLMCFNSVSSDKPYITLCGKPVDVVDNDLDNQEKASLRMCDSFTLSKLHSTFCNSFYDIELYHFNKAPLKMYIQHSVNVCAFYIVCLIPLIIILFLI